MRSAAADSADKMHLAMFGDMPQVEGAVEREAESLLGNGDLTGALYLRQVTGDVEPVVRAAIRSGSLTDQMVRWQ